MSLRTKVMIGLLSLTGTSALADATQTEFFYQTAAGKAAGTIQAGYIDRELKVNGPTAAATGTQKVDGLQQAGLRYEMGLSENFSLEGVLTYSALNVSPSTSGQDKGAINGLDNVQINLKGTNGSYSWGRLRYGVSNKIGIVPATYTNTNAGNTANNMSFNASSGNYTFTPYLGTDMDLGGGIIGAKVSYDLVKTDTVVHSPDGNSATLLYTGGQDLTAAVFYEILMDQSLLGLTVDYTNEGPSNTSAGPNKGWGKWGAKLYGRWGFADAWAIVPSVRYDIYGTKTTVDNYASLPIDSGTELNVNLAARYAF